MPDPEPTPSSRSRAEDYAPDTFRVDGDETCGRCFGTFSSQDPPMHVIRHSRGYDYPEDRPWHESCVAEANEEAATHTGEGSRSDG